MADVYAAVSFKSTTVEFVYTHFQTADPSMRTNNRTDAVAYIDSSPNESTNETLRFSEALLFPLVKLDVRGYITLQHNVSLVAYKRKSSCKDGGTLELRLLVLQRSPPCMLLSQPIKIIILASWAYRYNISARWGFFFFFLSARRPPEFFLAIRFLG